MDNLALRSHLMQKLFHILTRQKQQLERVRSEVTEILKWANSTTLMGIFNTDAPTKEERDAFHHISPFINRMRKTELTEEALDTAPDLAMQDTNGVWVMDPRGWEHVRDMGAVSLEDLQKGIAYQDIKDGKLQYELDAKGEPDLTKPIMVEVDMKGHKITPRVYDMIQQYREAIDTMAFEVYIQKLNGMREERDNTIDNIAGRYTALDNEEDKALLREIEEVYGELYNKGYSMEGAGKHYDKQSIARAERFLHHATRLMDDKKAAVKKADWTEKTGDKVKDDLTDFIGTGEKEGKYRDVVMPTIEKLIARADAKVGKGVDAGKVKAELAKLYVLQTQVMNAELRAKSTIASAYVPLVRRGEFQVRVAAYVEGDKEGVYDVPIALPEDIRAQMFYTRTNSRDEAQRHVVELNEVLTNKDYAPTEIEIDGVKQTVRFEADWSTSPQSSTLGSTISYDDFATVLVRSGINLKPQDRAKLVTMMTAEHSMPRKGLQKDFTPGWDPDISQGIAEHLEQHAHIAAKNRYHHRITNLMLTADRENSQGKWEGDHKEFADMQANYKDNHLGKDTEREEYMKLAKYQRQFIYSAAVKQRPWITKMAQDGSVTYVDGVGNGNHYYEKAKQIVDGYHRNQEAPASGDEKLAEGSSSLMSLAAMMQLGGSVAAGLINLMALETHTVLYLSTFNKKTGFGGGHDFMPSFIEMHRAGSHLSLFKDGLTKDVTGNLKTLEELTKSAKMREKYSLTQDEAQMLYEMTREGALTPNMFNQMSDVMRKGKFGKVASELGDKWMVMFAKTEQFNRRVTALSSYRLDKARLLASKPEGYELTKQDISDLHDRATAAVNYSQGNYDSFNRPALAQGNVIKYLWLYKQFQVITIQLMRNLGPKERTMMIAALLLLSGVKGVPFSDDLMDLIDGLMQMFGIKSAGVEAELSMLAEAAGIKGEFLTHGVVDSIVGATTSTRFAMGDQIPGTGLFREGADVGRELQGILGPVLSAVKGAYVSGRTAAAYGAETLGLKPDTTSLKDVLRTGGGFTALKNAAKGVIFMADGDITNERGQVVSKDAGIWAPIAQFFGFYPAAATQHYAAIRMMNNARFYRQSIKDSFTEAYRSAGSAKGRREVDAQVREWNRSAKGTMFYIDNWATSSRKSLKSAEQEATERNLDTLPKAMKKNMGAFLKSRGMDKKGVLN